MMITDRLDPSEALARETLRSRRRGLLAFASFLVALGAAFFALAIWFTDAAHYALFMAGATASLIGGAVVLVHTIRMGPTRPSARRLD